MTATGYITAADAEDLLAAFYGSSNPRRLAFEAASADDQAVFIARATREIDACLWIGRVVECDQTFMWPRLYSESNPVVIEPDPDEPDDAPVADLPRAVREACAVQAANIAQREAGTDPTGHLNDFAARGGISQGGGGMSETLDAEHARTPWARLCADAQALLAQYRAVGGSLR